MDRSNLTSPKDWLFVHGFWGSSFNWKSVVDRLNLAERAYVPDLLGHGKNATAEPRLSVDALAQDLVTQIAEPAQIHYAVVHSFGLRPFLKVAAEFKALRWLFVEDTCPQMTHESFVEIKNIIDACPEAFKDRAEAKSFLLKRFAYNTRLAQFLFTNVVGRGPEEAVFRTPLKSLLFLLEEAYKHSPWKEWSQLSCEICLILGANSKSVPPELVQKTMFRGPNNKVKLVEIAQSGHWVHADQMNQFVQTIQDVVGQ